MAPARPQVHDLLLAVIDTACSDLAAGTNLWPCPPVEEEESSSSSTVPGLSCWVWCDGGPSPGYTKDRHVLAQRTVVVQIRGARNSYDAGLDLAERVWYAASNAVLAGTVQVDATQAGPMYVGEHRGRHVFSMQFSVLIDDDQS